MDGTPHESAAPLPTQSVAALLPEEILDLVFARFDLKHSAEEAHKDRAERVSNLSNMSVIAEGWTRPARRLLFRRVTIWSWSHVQEEVEEGLGKHVRDLDINGEYWHAVTSREAAGAVFRLLKQLPNPRRLRLVDLRFDSFDPADSSSMQATALLPHLHDLNISNIPFPHSLIFDLLATSGHRIDRLTVQSDSALLASPVPYRQLDFRGKLRFLSTGAEFYRTLMDPRLVALEGLRGLEELQLQGIDVESKEGGEEMYGVIGPTLNALAIDSDDVTWFVKLVHLFCNLSRLSIAGLYSNSDPDSTPLLRCLPLSLSSLRLGTDVCLGPALARWIAAPSLVPARLKQIQIDNIYEFETYQQLPPVPTLRTNFHSITLNHLQQLNPATVPFKTLEMWFFAEDLNRRSEVEAECQRLGVKFR